MRATVTDIAKTMQDITMTLSPSCMFLSALKVKTKHNVVQYRNIDKETKYTMRYLKIPLNIDKLHWKLNMTKKKEPLLGF